MIEVFYLGVRAESLTYHGPVKDTTLFNRLGHIKQPRIRSKHTREKIEKDHQKNQETLGGGPVDNLLMKEISNYSGRKWSNLRCVMTVCLQSG